MPKRVRGPPAAPGDEACLVLGELQEAQMIQQANYDGEREKLIQLLLEDDYEPHLLSLARYNVELVEMRKRFTIGYHYYDLNAADRARADREREPTFELEICVLARVLNQRMTPFLLVCLSLLALQCRVPDGEARQPRAFRRSRL
jgi:hypothetical protein